MLFVIFNLIAHQINIPPCKKNLKRNSSLWKHSLKVSIFLGIHSLIGTEKPFFGEKNYNYEDYFLRTFSHKIYQTHF